MVPHALFFGTFSKTNRPPKRPSEWIRELPPGHLQHCNFSGGRNLREANTSPGGILLRLSADTLFSGVWHVQRALCQSRCQKKQCHVQPQLHTTFDHIALISKSMTMAATGAIRHRHSTTGNIQWLKVKPWMCSIGRCALCCTIPPHMHGNRHYQQFVCIFCCCRFVVSHYHR